MWGSSPNCDVKCRKKQWILYTIFSAQWWLTFVQLALGIGQRQRSAVFHQFEKTWRLVLGFHASGSSAERCQFPSVSGLDGRATCACETQSGKVWNVSVNYQAVKLCCSDTVTFCSLKETHLINKWFGNDWGSSMEWDIAIVVYSTLHVKDGDGVNTWQPRPLTLTSRLEVVIPKHYTFFTPLHHDNYPLKLFGAEVSRYYYKDAKNDSYDFEHLTEISWSKFYWVKSWERIHKDDNGITKHYMPH